MQEQASTALRKLNDEVNDQKAALKKLKDENYEAF